MCSFITGLISGKVGRFDVLFTSDNISPRRGCESRGGRQKSYGIYSTLPCHSLNTLPATYHHIHPSNPLPPKFTAAPPGLFIPLSFAATLPSILLFLHHNNHRFHTSC